MDDWCDYCKEDLPKHHYLRATGFTEFEGHTAPLVKTWCGECEPGDEADPEAQEALLAAVKAQWEDAL